MRLIVRIAANLLLLYLLTTAAVVVSAVWFALRPPTQTAGVLIVLGGAMTEEHTLGTQTRARVEAGVALFNAGAAPRMLFTGGGPADAVPAGEQMRALAVSLGVPAAVTAAETESHSTLQNALFSRPVLGPLADGPVMLVTDGFHLARAWASFRWAGYRQIRLAAATAFGDDPLPEQLHWIAREALAWWFNPARVVAFEVLERVRGPDPERIRMLD
ncbi:MAG: YdcF family protein [Amaricoccus sp.]